MSKKQLFHIIFFIILLYPVFTLVQLDQVRNASSGMELFQNVLSHFHISIWIVWIFMAALAVSYKWTTQKNTFFHYLYVYLLIGYFIYGWYLHQMVTGTGIDTGFKDDYTLVVLKTLQGFAVSAILTAFLQAAVWWFTRRWHRR